ncbi:MAG: hypothetical protein PHD01_11130 [Geobacteraceae bacterium]|nr:hypothetical protein [Geobacteraceae bacterium]
MKVLRIVGNAFLVSLATASGAFAATTTRAYSGGILLFAFLGLCALVVVAQLIPAIVVIFGMVKGLVQKEKDIQVVKVESLE